MKITTRILLLYIAGVIIFFAARSVFVPPSFGELGHFRAKSMEEIASIQTKVGENFECFDCHVKEYASWSVGEHKGISCMSCHGLIKAHAKSPDKHEARDEFLSYEAYPSIVDFCLSCHAESPSKPANFPQVTIEHGREEFWNCTTCHDPHNPVR